MFNQFQEIALLIGKSIANLQNQMLMAEAHRMGIISDDEYKSGLAEMLKKVQETMPK